MLHEAGQTTGISETAEDDWIRHAIDTSPD